MIAPEKLHESVSLVEQARVAAYELSAPVLAGALYHAPSEKILMVREAGGWLLPTRQVRDNETALDAFNRLVLNGLQVPETDIREVRGLYTQTPIVNEMKGDRTQYLALVGLTSRLSRAKFKVRTSWMEVAWLLYDQAMDRASQHRQSAISQAMPQILSRLTAPIVDYTLEDWPHS